MGAFNVINVEMACMHCEHIVPLVVQFKYGDVWQFEYLVGDELRWGKNNNGRPGARRVVVDGAAETCPHCGLDGDYEIFIIDNHIASVQPPARLYDFMAVAETYIVLDE